MKPIALLLTLFLLVPAGCASLGGKASATAAEHRSRAEELISARNFAEAARQLALAQHLDPGDGQLYLRRGEVLEALDRAEEARAVYEKGRRRLRRGDPRQPELTYRLALLQALNLGHPDRAAKLLEALPGGTPARIDLEGVLALQRGEAREALILFNQGLQSKPEREHAACILYHAALAYQHFGDEKNTFGSLHRAIGLTEHLGTTRNIERLFRKLTDSGAPP